MLNNYVVNRHTTSLSFTSTTFGNFEMGNNHLKQINTNQKRLRIMKKTYLILVGIGLVFLTIATITIVNTLNFRSSAILTDGSVVRMNESRSDKGTLLTAPVISFNTKDGQEYLYQSNIYSNPSSYSIGEKVPIYYDPLNPNHAQTGGMTLSIVLASIGGVFFLIGLIIYLLHINKDKNIKILMETGEKIKADIVSVNYNTSLAINGKNPMVIECQWLQNYSNTLYSFKSRNLWFDPTPYLGERKQLDVFINPNNPKKYFMDVSFLPKEG